MWRLLLVATFVLVAGIAAATMTSRTAHACSRGPYDLVAEADVIVAGRYVRYEAIPNPPSKPRVYFNERTGQEEVYVAPASLSEVIELAVDRVVKGSVTSGGITIVEEAIVDPQLSGSCERGAYDPTGRYTIVGLVEREEGAYRRSAIFFLGDGPYGEDYHSALTWMASFPAAASLPSLGAEPLPSAGKLAPIAIAAGLGAAGAALLGAFVILRLRTRRAT